MKKTGFTLAEVLITLGVIGVISAMTLPTVIKHYKQQATVNRLKQAYTVLYQAINMSEINNGNFSEWELPVHNQEISHQDWASKYIAPYLKHTYIKGDYLTSTQNKGCIIHLANGIKIEIYRYRDEKYLNCIVILPGKNLVRGKNVFWFYIGKDVGYGDKKLRPYDAGITKPVTRDSWKDGVPGCNKFSSTKVYCSGLIMHDGWQIKDDYPW